MANTNKSTTKMKKQNFATAELDIKKSVAPETYLLLLNL